MNDTTIMIAPVRKTVRVNAPIAHAFDVFTNGFSRWWPRDHSIAKKPISKLLLEPRLGGRWLEISDDGTQTKVARSHFGSRRIASHWFGRSMRNGGRIRR